VHHKQTDDAARPGSYGKANRDLRSPLRYLLRDSDENAGQSKCPNPKDFVQEFSTKNVRRRP